MHSNKSLIIVSLLFFASTILSEEFNYDLNQDTSNWSDPGDMFNYDTRTKTNVEVDQEGADLDDKQKCDCTNNGNNNDDGSPRNSNCDPILDKLIVCRKENKVLSNLTKVSSCSERIVTFVSRSVRKLVLKLKNFEERLTDEELITVSNDVNPKKIELIDQFVNKAKLDCRRVDEFEEAFYEVIDNMSYVNRSNHSLFHHLLNNYGFTCSVILAILSLLLFAYRFYYMPLYARLTTIYFLMVLISFVWQWIQLYQKVVSEKHYTMSSAPKECIELKNDKVFTFSSIFFSYIKTVDKECKEYYRALMVNPVFEVNPLTAGSHALSTALFAPISIFMDKLGEGFSSFYSHFSFTEKFIVSIVLSIILTILLIFSMGYSIHLPFFLGSIVRGPQMPTIDHNLYPTNSYAISQRSQNINGSDERPQLTSRQFRRPIIANEVQKSGVSRCRDLTDLSSKKLCLSRSRSLPSLV